MLLVSAIIYFDFIHCYLLSTNCDTQKQKDVFVNM